MRKIVLAAMAALALAAPVHILPAGAQEFPNKPVKLIVPVAPGGGTDVLGRVLADRMAEIWGQPVVVENRPGAGHIIGTTALSQAGGDGYTIGMMGMPHVVNPALRDLPYKALEDFTPLAMLAHIPLVMVVHPSVEAKTVAELVALAKAKPGTLNFAATSPNGAGHLAGELFKMRAGIDMTFVSYAGSAPALQDLLAGRTQVMLDALLTARPHIQSGALRPLAVTTANRARELPNVPTMIESGYADFNVSAWLGLLAPKGTPAPVAAKITSTVVAALDTPAVREKLEAQGWTLLPMGRESKAFTDYMTRELVVWRDVAKAAKLKP